jgi:hypothetical protein
MHGAISTAGFGEPTEHHQDPAEHRENAAAVGAETKRLADEAAAKEKALRDSIAANPNSFVLADEFANLVILLGNTKGALSAEADMTALSAEAAHYLEKSIERKASLEVFDLLILLAPGPETDRAVVASCGRVRALVPAEEVNDFTGECLDRAGGDAKKLKWAGASKDVMAYLLAEKTRKAQMAMEEAKAEAVRVKIARYMAASVFASGRCKFSNCLRDGWTVTTPEGDIDVSCSFQNCFKDGWTARFPDGTQATTRCSFSDCTKDGWETSFPDGTTLRTRCSFQNCLKDGWTTDLPDGESSITHCSFSDCAKDGWETSLPGGGSIQCRCNFQKCFENGTSCE